MFYDGNSDVNLTSQNIIDIKYYVETSFFFVWFWSRSGQTIGMKAWRLRVQNQDGTRMSKTTAIARLLPTLLGLGNIMVLFDRNNKLSLQDKITNTEVVVLSLEENKGRL